MSKLEPLVFICIPDYKKGSECYDFHYSALPKWIQLYILRWWERKHKDAAT